MHNEAWITIWHSNNDTYMVKEKCTCISSLPPSPTEHRSMEHHYTE